MRLTFNNTLYGLPVVGEASFRSVKELTSKHQFFTEECPGNVFWDIPGALFGGNFPVVNFSRGGGMSEEI